MEPQIDTDEVSLSLSKCEKNKTIFHRRGAKDAEKTLIKIPSLFKGSIEFVSSPFGGDLCITRRCEEYRDEAVIIFPSLRAQ